MTAILVKSEKIEKEGIALADYQKMYAVLCGAVDEVIDPLGKIPEARPFVRVLQSALHETERLYVDTTTYLAPTDDPQVIELKLDRPAER